MRQVDLEEPTPLLDQVFLGCTQRECKSNRKIVEENKNLLESFISASTIRQSHGWERSHVNTVAWSCDMERHAKKCVEGNCELAHKKMEQFFKVSTSCIDDPQFKGEELENCRNCAHNSS